MRTLLTFSFVAMAYLICAQPIFELQLVLQGLSQPVDMTHAGDDRLFIVERGGRIRILDGNGDLLSTPFLDINDRVGPPNGERGLLGLTFHPNYTENGFFFVNYTDNGGDTRISKFQVTEGNANIADPDSEVILMEINQP